MGADGQEQSVVAFGPQSLEVVHAAVGHDIHAQRGDVGHVLVNHLVGEAIWRQRQAHHAAR